MKKRMICLLVVALFIFSNTAFATNWVWVGKTEASEAFPVINSYLDADSVLKNGDTVIFWRLYVLDKPYKGYTRFLYQAEGTLTDTRSVRDLQIYDYDADKNETVEATSPGENKTVPPGSLWDSEINAALKYAKESQKPKLPSK